MKNIFKRSLSVIMTLAVLLSLLVCAASVSAASISYNNGKREVLCTSLSADAKSYYTGNYTYEKLSALSASSLRTTLRTLINSDRDTVGYGGLRDYMKYTDAYQGSTSKLVLFYCNGTTNSAWDSAKTWNREHMWPDSLGGSAMEGDLHAMRPTDPNINSTRGNLRYGEVSGGSAAKANSLNGNRIGGYRDNSLFEPLDNAKGDCARVVLYDYVVTSSMSSVTTVFESVDTLLAWCAQDPVDEYEMSRNDVGQEIEGCRNPFVDYPELGWILMGKPIPAGMSTPSGNTGEAYTITAKSNNTAYGTVSLSGNTVTATPKTGYKVAGYTLDPTNAATVSQSGNVFTLSNVKADCTITINFVAKQVATITYSVPEGVSVNGVTSGYIGESLKLATISGKPTDTSHSYSFVGWGSSEIEKTETKPATKAAGSNFTPAAAQTDFYGVFSYMHEGKTYYITSTCAHESTHEEIVEPTCTESGAKNVVCDNCGAIVDTVAIDKLGHDYVLTVVAPTCTEKGYDLYTCSRCGDSYKKNYTDAAHDYVMTVVAPTCTEKGYDLYTCSRCGDSYEKNYTDIIDHADADSDNRCDHCGTELETTTPPTPVEFSDVKQGNWFYDAIRFVSDHKLMNGVGDNQFAPNASITRAMLVTILYRIEEEPSTEGMNHPFADVVDGQWYTEAIIWAANNGIVNGTSATTFSPDVAISREQIAAIMYRYSNSIGLDVSVEGTDLSGYPDASTISGYAVEAMTWAISVELIRGMDGKLAPTATATRAQFATILQRYFENLLP